MKNKPSPQIPTPPPQFTRIDFYELIRKAATQPAPKPASKAK